MNCSAACRRTQPILLNRRLSLVWGTVLLWFHLLMFYNLSRVRPSLPLSFFLGMLCVYWGLQFCLCVPSFNSFDKIAVLLVIRILCCAFVFIFVWFVFSPRFPLVAYVQVSSPPSPFPLICNICSVQLWVDVIPTIFFLCPRVGILVYVTGPILARVNL